ncbi:MAG: class I SAM-dependent methyltransferase [Ignavibacteriales bacterium]|nr:class I SAM-dependent methyltransferase [Ignavibacteriales bacterium]
MNEIEKEDQYLFNTIANKYSRKDDVLSSSIARRFQLFSLMELIKSISTKSFFERIIEIGCGVGASSKYLDGYYKQYVGIDYSKEIIQIANKRYSKDNVEFICSNIKEFRTTQIPNLVIGIGILHHMVDLDTALKELNEFTNNETIIAFIEPNSGNPFIQLLRMIRKIIDKSYSEDQSFFSKKDLLDLFSRNGFVVEGVKYEGYFSPPFAQVIIQPQFIFKSISYLTTMMDGFIQKHFNFYLSWNIMIVVKSKTNPK